jgi:uncharacterized protein YjlB
VRLAFGKKVDQLMFEFEALKKIAERATGIGRPNAHRLQEALRIITPSAYRFKDNNLVPNNPSLSVLIYRNAVHFPRGSDPAAVLEDLFAINSWGDMWRGEIYDYAHYHPSIHEALAIARGHASVQLGGSEGRRTVLKAGDIIVIPAGTGHQALRMSQNFMAIGAYPPTGKYSEYHPTKSEHDRAIARIRKTAIPKKDPLYGAQGPLVKIWRRR